VQASGGAVRRAAQRLRSLVHIGLPYYYLFLAILTLTLRITWWMTNSRMGFYLRAIREFRTRGAFAGCPASRTKLYLTLLSAGLTSVAGALYAMMFGFVDPESGLGILISVKILIMAALRRRPPVVRAAGGRCDPGALEKSPTICWAAKCPA